MGLLGASISVTRFNAAVPTEGPDFDAVAFRAFETPLGGFLESRAGAGAHLAGRLERDEWNGRVRAKLTIEDAAPPS